MNACLRLFRMSVLLKSIVKPDAHKNPKLFFCPVEVNCEQKNNLVLTIC